MLCSCLRRGRRCGSSDPLAELSPHTTAQPVTMAPLVLRMALPARPVQMARRTPVRSSRAVRVRANSDELSRIAEIEEEIARQVSWGLVRGSARRLGRFCSPSCWRLQRSRRGADSPVGRTPCLLATTARAGQRTAVGHRPAAAGPGDYEYVHTPQPLSSPARPVGPKHGSPAALRSCTGLDPWHRLARSGPPRLVADLAGHRPNCRPPDLPVTRLGPPPALAAGALSHRHRTGAPSAPCLTAPTPSQTQAL